MSRYNALSQYDARDNHVEFTYDSLNRKTQHIQHKSTGNVVTRYTAFDEVGNLKEMTDATGRRFTFDYDVLNRQTDEYYPAVTSPLNMPMRTHRSYDGNNNVLTISEYKLAANSQAVTDETVNNYDDFDRLDDSTQRGVTVDYGYDDNGNRTSVATDNGTTIYTFDSRNRLETVTVDADITIYGYYPDGKKDTVTYSNGTDVKYDLQL